MSNAVKKILMYKGQAIKSVFACRLYLNGEVIYEDGWQSAVFYTVQNRKRVIINEEQSRFHLSGKILRDEVKKMEVATGDRVWFSVARTLNIGDFNSVKVEAGHATGITENETPDEAFERVQQPVKKVVLTNCVKILKDVGINVE